ncbi:MAG TPA: tetratricopeptide repeat protein, partial [Paludibacteraceae bacterium]|nr:tetratricopeptide repeat protein [Paludibacteraceae bacterium]
MKRLISNIILIITLLASLPLSAQSDAVKYANDLYAKGNFHAAAEQYEKILKNEGIAPELYYNLGNAYYKMNEIGLAILNYERALKLSPRFEDARFNLQLAQQKVLDNVNYNQQFFIQRWITNLMHMFTSNQWFTAGYLFFLAALIFAFLFAFGSSVRQRKNSFYIGIVLLLF